MRRAATSVVLAIAIGLGAALPVDRAFAEDPPADDPPIAGAPDADAPVASVEIVGPERPVYVGERVRVELRAAIVSRIADGHLIDLYARSMDVPIRIAAPWADNLPDAAVITPAPPRLTLVLNDAVVTATRGPAASLTRYTVGVGFVPTEAGALELAAPSLRLAYATAFDDDFLNGLQPRDRHDVTVEGTPLTLEVVALPTDGRPDAFTGAIGEFTVLATAGAAEVEAGGSVSVTLEITGDGNLARFDAPRLQADPAFAGFHVFGETDDRGTPTRTIRYDLVPESAAVTEVPAIELHVFDPQTAEYGVVRTAAAPLRVRDAADATSSDGPGAPGGADPPEVADPSTATRPSALTPISEPEGASPGWLIAILAVVVVAIALLLRRRGAAVPESPAESRTRGALAALRGSVAAHSAAHDADLATCLAQFLADHLDCELAAVIAPDLSQRLQAAAVAPELAERTAREVETLIAARYGGAAPGPAAAARVTSLAEELDAAFAG